MSSAPDAVMFCGFGLRSACVAALVLISPVKATAGAGQYVDVVYERPEGWVSMVEGYDGRTGYRTLSRTSEETCRDCLLFLTASQSAPSDLAAMATRSTSRFLLRGDPALSPVTAPEAADFGAMRVAVGSWMLGDDILFLTPVQQGSKAALIGFRGPASTPDALTESSETFQATLVAMLEGLHFTPPGPPAMPPPAPGPLEGVYWGSVTRSTMGMDGFMQMDIQGRSFVFWKDGWFHDGAPRNGLDPPTPPELIPGGPQGDGDWGTYRVDGKDIRVTYIGGGTESFRLSASGGTIHDGDREMFPVDPLKDGETISGSTESSFYSGFNPVMATGGVASRSYTIYYPDGTYEDGGWSSVTANIQGGTTADPQSLGGVAGYTTTRTPRGRYEIKGGVIRFFPPDGSGGGRALIYRVGDDSIFIGTQPLN